MPIVLLVLDGVDFFIELDTRLARDSCRRDDGLERRVGEERWAASALSKPWTIVTLFGFSTLRLIRANRTPSDP
jgi:hypothetical protein